MKGVRIKVQLSGPAEEDIMVWGQAPCSPGRKKWRHAVYLGVVGAGESREVDTTAWYVGRFGEPEPGQKVFIRTEQQRDGWKGRANDVSGVMPAKAALNGLRALDKMADDRGLRCSHARRGSRTATDKAGMGYDAHGSNTGVVP